MTSSKGFRLRRARSRYWAVVTVLAMIFSPTGIPFLAPQAPLQAQAQGAPVGAGFVLDREDLRFIFHQIEVAQDHAAGGTLLGPGPNQVHNPQNPDGLRTVDGTFNNLVPVPDQ
ncbi:MAG TPA: hypothetical protein VGJ78_23635, partial [Vicinamibacterales bacterium]